MSSLCESNENQQNIISLKKQTILSAISMKGKKINTKTSGIDKNVAKLKLEKNNNIVNDRRDKISIIFNAAVIVSKP